MPLRLAFVIAVLASLGVVHAPAIAQARWNTTQKIVLQDDFRDTSLAQWTHSIEDRQPHPVNSERIDIVQAPGQFTGHAVRFEVPGKAGTWRSELALFPVEQGFKERWYSQGVAVERIATDASGFIVMQWHALMGNDRVTRNFPNMSIAVKNDRWVIRRAWGSPAAILRSEFQVPDITVVPRQWADWVVRVRWSEGADGRIDAWLNDRLVYTVQGPNLYLLTNKTTPYYKTGIYRPSRKEATTDEPPTVVYVRNVKIGRQDAKLDDMRPPRQALWHALVSRATGGCIDFSGRLASGNPVVTQACGDASTQRFLQTAEGTLLVADLCVAVRDSVPVAPIHAAKCNGGQEQRWRVEWDGSVRSLGGAASRCLAVSASVVTLAQCKPGSAEQQFLARPFATWVSRSRGRCMDSEGGLGPGKRLIAWDCHGGRNQQLRWMHGPHQKIRVADLCVHAVAAKNKADVDVRDCDGSINQQWAVETNLLLRSLLPAGQQYCMDLAREDANNVSLLPCWPPSRDQQFWRSVSSRQCAVRTCAMLAFAPLTRVQ